VTGGGARGTFAGVPASEQPRWFFGQPPVETVEGFLRAQENVAFGYAEVGASNGGAPAGYTLDENRVVIGQGALDFSAACEALRAWRMFPAGWTKISPPRAPIVAGQTVAMQARGLGLWWLNACRIVYLLDEAGPVRRFGFAYGTLPAHVEQGEERFSVELHPDGTVWYDLRAFSRPRFWPVRLAKPLARRLQGRFVRESLASMQQAVRESRTGS
jgi:uncharacterized protein (UPF0548 family)